MPFLGGAAENSIPDSQRDRRGDKDISLEEDEPTALSSSTTTSSDTIEDDESKTFFLLEDSEEEGEAGLKPPKGACPSKTDNRD